MAALSEVIDGLNLNTGGYYVASRDYGSPNFEPVLLRRRRGATERLVSLSCDGSRRIRYTVECQGATTDATIGLVTALYAKLPTKGTAKNLVVTPTDATYGVTFVCLALEGELPSPYDVPMDVGHRATVSFVLVAEPYAYGPEATLVNAVSTTYPGVVDVTVPGDFPSPLHLTFAGTDLHCLYAGLLPNQATALPLSEGESLTWATGGGATVSTIADAKFRGGNAKSLSATLNGYASAPIVDTDLPLGTYKMLARVGNTGASNSDFLTDPPNTRFNLNGLDLGVYDLGSARLPASAVIGAAASSYAIYMESLDGGRPYVDYVATVPMSWGWAYWHAAGNSLVTSQIVVAYDGRVYSAGVAAAATGRCGGLNAVGSQRLVVVADTLHFAGTGNIALTTTVKVVPRYVLWR